MDQSTIYLIITGAVIVVLFISIVVLWRQYLSSEQSGQRHQRELDLIKADLEQKQIQLLDYKSEKEHLEEQLDKSKQLNADLQAQNASLQTHRQNAAEQIDELRKKYEDLNKEWQSLSQDYSQAKTQNENLKEKLEHQKKEIDEMGEKLKDQFTVLADKIMRRNSEFFKKESSEKLNQLLDPFKENLQNLRKKVEETYTSEKAERISLKDQIKGLLDMNKKLSKEADDLVQALKGSSKSQGNWGEMLLETILENSGLVKGENYFREEELRDEEGVAIKSESGRKMRPDVIVKYPDGRVIIIDSKVSLNAYVKFSEESDLEKQERYLDKHVLSIQKHIDNLSKKEYDQFERSPEFVMMFIPIEPAYHFALRQKPTLWSYAWEKRVCLMSPTNLIAALRLVEEVWKKEKQNQNARDIADRAGKLYDKFVGVYDSFKKIGKHLNDATSSYEEAQNRLKDGRGSAIRQVEMLKELGAATKQSLPTEKEDE